MHLVQIKSLTRTLIFSENTNNFNLINDHKYNLFLFVRLDILVSHLQCGLNSTSLVTY